MRSKARARRIGVLVIFSAGCVVACAQLAGIEEGIFDGSGPPTRDAEPEASSSARDATDVDREELDARIDGPDDASIADGGGDAADAGNPCVGKPDDTRIPAGSGTGCCGQKIVDLRSNEHCGGCGLVCSAAGSTCKELPDTPGRYACTCTTDSACKGQGYGAAASCYAGKINSGFFCQCQCTGATAADPTCAGQCAGGGTCMNVPNEVINYCAY